MKLYLAGQFYPKHAPGLGDLDGLRFLVSYAYMHDPQTRAVVDWCTEHGYPLFLDSGAYSADTLGSEISLEEYRDHCLEHADRYETIAALDVIGDARASRRNWEAMRDAGVDCIPTFHAGEPWDDLVELLEATDHIALGGVARRVYLGNQSRVMAWIARCFRTVEEVRPGARVHGFGMTSTRIMASFPWDSVDSTSWLAARRFAVGFWRDGARIRQFRRGEEGRVPPEVAERFLSLTVGAPGGNSLRYAPLLVNNARVLTEWVSDLNRFQELTT